VLTPVIAAASATHLCSPGCFPLHRSKLTACLTSTSLSPLFSAFNKVQVWVQLNSSHTLKPLPTFSPITIFCTTYLLMTHKVTMAVTSLMSQRFYPARRLVSTTNSLYSKGVGMAGATGALAPAMLKPRGRGYFFAPAILSQIFACYSLNFQHDDCHYVAYN